MPTILANAPPSKQDRCRRAHAANPAALALDEVVVIGWTADRKLHFAGSEADMQGALMLLTLAQRWITDQYDLT